MSPPEIPGVTFLPSWASATDPTDTPPLRVFDKDGTVHFTNLKAMALSGRQYLASVNEEREPSSVMLLGTLVHFLVFGVQRAGGKRLVKYDGRRAGKAWEAFEAENADAEILTAAQWAQGERIAEAVLRDPVARARLDGARFEVPLTWEESGLKLSTSGVDIVALAKMLGDLKTTPSVCPDAFMRHAFKMLYPQQVAFYRRGAIANGIDVSHGGFILGVETRAPFEVVELELTEGMLDYADRTVTLWLEKLRVCIDSCPEPRAFADWPGYAQAPIPWDVPAWMQSDEDGDEEDEEAAA